MKTLLLLFFGLILLGSENFSQDYKGRAGVLIETKNGAELNTSAADYEIDLMPGQSFTGYYYRWSNGTTITGSFQTSPSVSWLTLNPTSITSNNCNDIKLMQYNFTAPNTPGTYNTSVIDNNNNWSPHTILLTVTNTPIRNRFDSSVTIVAGQSSIRYQTSSYLPITNFGCNPSYFSHSQIQVNYTLFPNVSWLTINPNIFSLNQNQSITAQKTFTNNTQGTYFTIELRTRQSYSYPQWTYWSLNVLTGLNIISSEIPKQFSLLQNYPNPFNPTTNIKFSLPKYGNISLAVYDIKGQEIAKLVNNKLQPGTYEVDWNAPNYPSGIYFYTLRTESFTETKKMILIK